MVPIDILYEGDLRCRLTHRPSGKALITDAPVDNQGKGESFSPTDLVASALGSCMMTVMGIYAKKNGIDLKGTRLEVVKEMVADPDRRIGSLKVTVNLASGIAPDRRKPLEGVALSCPVYKSLNPSVHSPAEFIYPD
jgi:putative redox protein